MRNLSCLLVVFGGKSMLYIYYLILMIVGMLLVFLSEYGKDKQKKVLQYGCYFLLYLELILFV